MRYNDPDVALSQSDEDRILGLDAPPTEEEAKEGKFAALQVRLTLGTSSYATMALRQVTSANYNVVTDPLLQRDHQGVHVLVQPEPDDQSVRRPGTQDGAS